MTPSGTPEFHFIGALDRETPGNVLLLFRGFLWGRRSERARRLSGYPDFFPSADSAGFSAASAF
jgi:hypothetical protein